MEVWQSRRPTSTRPSGAATSRGAPQSASLAGLPAVVRVIVPPSPVGPLLGDHPLLVCKVPKVALGLPSTVRGLLPAVPTVVIVVRRIVDVAFGRASCRITGSDQHRGGERHAAYKGFHAHDEWNLRKGGTLCATRKRPHFNCDEAYGASLNPRARSHNRTRERRQVDVRLRSETRKSAAPQLRRGFPNRRSVPAAYLTGFGEPFGRRM